MELKDEFWLKEAQRVARVGMYIYDIKTNTWTTSDILDEILGTDDSYVKDFEGWLNVIHPGDREEIISIFYETIKIEKSCEKEFRIVRQSDKAERWVKGEVKLYYDESGMPDKLAGIIQDISELKQSEERYKKLYEEFQQKEAFLMSLINSIPDLFFYKDINSVYLGCNKAFEAFVGLEEKDLIGKSDFDIFNKEEAEFFRARDLEMIHKGEHHGNEEWIKYPDGKSVLVDTLKTPYFDSEGNILGLIGISRDITERKKKEELQRSIEEERRRLNELQEYDRIKTDFFANISHELRTPVNVIFSALQMYELKLKTCTCKKASTEIYKYTKMMKQNCYRLLRLINNLIDITKIDNGYFHINETNYDIISLVENITQSVAGYVEDKGLSLIFDTEVEEKVIACDPEKIERIILNLLSNAVKFTPYGGNIVINMEDKVESICISVKDTGRGIPVEKMNAIFERFIQVDKSFARDHEGSGIGLSLVKALVELHGGTIKVFSELDKGSEFVVELPVKTVERAKFEQYDRYNEDNNFYVDKLNIEFSDIYF
jgi:PAS domain S-box-containing protein